MLSEISNSQSCKIGREAEGIKSFRGGNTSERKKKKNVRKTCHITNAIHAQIDKEEGMFLPR
jgi:hypothetical protein